MSRLVTDLVALDRATDELDPPLAALDLDAARANLADLARRSGGTPVRVASKSVRCRHVLELALATPGFAGVMAFSLREALWLVSHGLRDVLMGYPTADRGALAALGADPVALQSITLMVDDPGQVAMSPPGARICLDVDASLRIGRLHLGVRRSPLRTSSDAAALARTAVAAGLQVVGVMFYEAQIAGLPDSSPAVRAVKKRSAAELRERRGEVVRAVRHAVGPLQLVNSGGTGSVEVSSSDPVVTEVTAGSGIYVPTLFDKYRAFAPRPALYFALPVVRRPAPRIATLFGGGYIASGPSGKSRAPAPAVPGLTLLGAEGAGEVQTPVRGAPADRLRVGDRVWFRPAKAGEQLERFDTLHVVEGDAIVASVPTYRGEHQTFG
jgi:D-serine deaminase-like pyridoxal phosphate-dependent protein